MVVNRMGRDWDWPDYDTQLIRVFDYVTDLDAAIQYAKRGTAVQAGGAVGVWPWYLSKVFDRVITFEPEPENYRCLTENAGGVEAHRAALGASTGRASVAIGENANAGTWHLVGGNDVPVMTIDSLLLDDCDLIVLDVEGSELDALKGAELTIERFHPVVMLEQKSLPHMKGSATAASDYLCREFGYKVTASVHRDLILC